jgi:hypothetical protein
VIRLWWAKFAGTVQSSTVVVANALGEHHTQVSLTEDQHAVGEFGSEGAHEPFGEAVRPRATSRNPLYRFRTSRARLTCGLGKDQDQA